MFLDIRRWPHWTGSYNIAPTQLAPVVIHTADGNICELMRFGLVPYFTHREVPKYSTINARIENLTKGPRWRGPWKRSQRCLVLASGFYEWHILSDYKTKQPYLVRPQDRESLAFAGLWHASRAADGTVHVQLCNRHVACFPTDGSDPQRQGTRTRNAGAQRMHNMAGRQCRTGDQAVSVLKQYPDELLLAYPVSRRVNSPKNNDARLIEKEQPDERAA